MAIEICWLDDLLKAQETARKVNKPILLDFYNPQCLGCQQMGAVTHPDERVARFISLNFVPVQVQTSNQMLMQRFAVSWTPTLLVLDSDGREHYRTWGFFSPEDLVATFLTAKGRWALGTDQLPEARALFEEVISCYPG
ncbi:MAG: thioredoxin family protein [Desulfobaccales bacterium]